MKKNKIKKNVIRAVIIGAVLGSFNYMSAFANELENVAIEAEDIVDIAIEDTTNSYEVTIENEPIVRAVGPESLGASLGNFKLTSYCSCRRCNGRWTGYPTAAGTNYEYGRTIAVDRRVIPLGTWVYINIPGEGWQKFRAEDTGSAIKGNRIDVYVGDNHGECYQARYNQVSEVRLALD